MSAQATGRPDHSDMEDVERKRRKREAHRKWVEANPDKYRDAKWRAQMNGTYGPGAADHWEAMNALQGGLCAVCGEPETVLGRSGEPRRLCLDHDHQTGVWRGLLCSACNFLIGHARERANVLHAAVEYLGAHA